MFIVAGSNIFGQWLLCDNIFKEFKIVSCENSHKIEIDKLKLIGAYWSYNIFKIDCDYYISGAWRGEENQFVKIPLPVECTSVSDVCVVGNDYKLIILSKQLNKLWTINLECENDIKKIKLTVETPINEGNFVKKIKQEVFFLKVVSTNHCMLSLSNTGFVYIGFLPSYLDIKVPGEIIDIQCGYEHFMLLTDLGAVYTWGNGRRLQLGHGDLSNLDIPTEVEALAGIKIVNICAGGWHSLALSESGDLYAWGWNDAGQLGIKEDKKDEPKMLPTVVDIFDNGKEVTLNVKGIGCGSRHSAILLEDNTVWTTGNNKYGQLGFPPELYESLKSFKKAFCSVNDCSVVCGPWCTVIIK